jgi:hypothetical protein
MNCSQSKCQIFVAFRWPPSRGQRIGSTVFTETFAIGPRLPGNRDYAKCCTYPEIGEADSRHCGGLTLLPPFLQARSARYFSLRAGAL